MVAVLLAGCGGDEAGTPSAEQNTATPAGGTDGTDGTGRTATPTAPSVPPGQLPPAGLGLQGLLADPDPRTQGPNTGPITVARLKKDDSLPTADIACLENNGFTLGYSKDGAGTEPTAVTWVFQLSSAEGAVNCADQMRRTDGFAGPVSDRTASYGLDGVRVYSVAARAGNRPLSVLRALYTNGDKLFRITVSQLADSPAPFEARFRALLQDQVSLAQSG